MAEILLPGTMPVIVQPHPFSAEARHVQLGEGVTLADIVAAAGIHDNMHGFIRIWIGDSEIPRHLWRSVRPKAGAHVYVRAMPHGGGGNGKNILGTILMLVVTIGAAIFAPMLAGAMGFQAGSIGFKIATGLIGSGISMLGAMAVAALIPPPTVGDTGLASQRALLSGVRNQFQPYATIPRIMGKRRVYPLQAARPYTEAQGKNRYLRVLLCVGWGPLKITDIRIGDTPITNFENIQYQVREGWASGMGQFGTFPFNADVDYNFNGSLQGWTATNATLSTSSTFMTITPTTNDPTIQSPTGLTIDGAKNTKVRARVRRTSGSAWDGYCYYTTAGHGFSASYYKRIVTSPILANDTWYEIEFDMADLTVGGTDWVDNTITRIRLDLSNNTGSTYDVDWIRVGDYQELDRRQTLFTKSVNEETFNVLLDGTRFTLAQKNALDALLADPDFYDLLFLYHAFPGSPMAIPEEDWLFYTNGTVLEGLPQTVIVKSSSSNYPPVIDTFTSPPVGSSVGGIGEWQMRVTEPDTDEVSVDVTATYGFAKFNDEGGTEQITVNIDVQYRKVGDVAWSDAVWDGNDTDDGTDENGRIIFKDKSRTPTIRGGRFVLPEVGQYEVRLRRATGLLTPDHRHAQRLEWTALRSIKYENPINQKGLAIIALRMKATDQFNSIPDTINCVAQSYLPTYDGSSWTYALTRNPGWAYADIMRRRGTQRLMADSRIDVDGVRQFALACAATAPDGEPDRWRFDGIIERGSVFTALKQIAGHARATFALKDGRYSVVHDLEQTVPVQHITPRNSWGYSGNKAFVDLPHALKVQFINAANGYQEDEVIVYADDYDETTAEKYETLDFPACTEPKQAWRDGRYFLAVGKLRPETHTVNMDIEQLRCSPGDLVRLSHDVLSIGVGSGRIASRIVSGSDVTGFVLDGVHPMDNNESYALRVRRSNGVSVVYGLSDVTADANVSTVTLATPVPTSGAPDVGDLYMFGITGLESAPMLVKRIEPIGELTAKLTLVDAQPGVWTADTEEIPAFNTYITDDTPIPQKRPAQPSFTIASDETVVERLADGSLQDRIGITVIPPAATKVRISGFEVQYRETGSVEWRQVLVARYGGRQVFISPVRQGDQYDVRVRSLSEDGLTSDWKRELAHTVIGKTTRPAQVTNFAASASVNGVQLSWDANPEIDVVGYRIKIGTDWDTATLLSSRVSGTSFFAKIEDAGSQTFLIKAIDAVNLLSETPAAVSAAIARPENVRFFEVFQQGDNIRAVWRRVPGQDIEYEVRNGASWAVGRRVFRSAGDTATVRWPVREANSPYYWIKAVSSAGLYSVSAYFATTAQNPIPNRNVIIDTDFSAENWPGTLTGLDRIGSGVGSVLSTARDELGNFLPYGEFTYAVDLPREYSMRAWLELETVLTANSTQTWEMADFSWEDATALSWIGALIEDSTAEIIPEISVGDASAQPDDLVEAFSFNGTLAGSASTAPLVATGIRYAPLRARAGVALEGAVLTYNRTLPAAYTVLLDFKRAAQGGNFAPALLGYPADPSTDMTGSPSLDVDWTVLRLRNVAATWELRLHRDASAGTYILSVTGQDDIVVAAPFESSDLVTFGVSQSATTRTLMVFNARTGLVYSGSVEAAPGGAVEQVLFWGSGEPGAPGIIGDVELRSAAMTLDAFSDYAPVKSPVGFRPWQIFVPADHTFQNAMIRLRFKGVDGSLQLTASKAILRLDVPDILEMGSVEITNASAGAVVTFGRSFAETPNVVVSQEAGAVIAIPRIVSGPTATGFTVRLYDAANPATAVTGTITYSALGY